MIMVLPRQSSWRRMWWTHPELSLAAVAAAAWLAVLTVHITTGPFHAAAQHFSTLMPEQAMPGHQHGASNPGIAGHQYVMSDPGWAPTFLVSVGLWVVMATAMMLPTTLPAARSISLNGKWKRRQRGPALFAVGYLAVWSAVGVLLLCAVCPQWGLVHGLVWADDGRDGAGSAFGRAVVDAAPVCRGLGGEVADEGGLLPRAGRYRARHCRNRRRIRGTGHLAEVATSTDSDRPDTTTALLVLSARDWRKLVVTLNNPHLASSLGVHHDHCRWSNGSIDRPCGPCMRGLARGRTHRPGPGRTRCRA